MRRRLHLIRAVWWAVLVGLVDLLIYLQARKRMTALGGCLMVALLAAPHLLPQSTTPTVVLHITGPSTASWPAAPIPLAHGATRAAQLPLQTQGPMGTTLLVAGSTQSAPHFH